MNGLKLLQKLPSFRHFWASTGYTVHAQVRHRHHSHHNHHGLSLQYEEDVAIIHINDGSDNRINYTFLKNINSLLDSVVGNSSCKGLVTTGEGKYYSNGLDLEWMETITGQELIEFMHDLQRLYLKILLFPLPTLAVLNGHTYAGGAILAFAHDLRTINSDKGWLCFNEVHLNKRISSFKKEFLKIKLGGGKNVSDALVLGRRYSSDDAHRNHLVHAAYPSQSLLDSSLQVLQSFYGKDGYTRQGLLNMKKDIYKLPIEAFDRDMKDKLPYMATQFMTESQLSSIGV